jgi:hypothetical protein
MNHPDNHSQTFPNGTNPPFVQNWEADRQKEIEALAAIQLPDEERTSGMTKHLLFLEAQINHLILHEKPIFNGEFFYQHDKSRPLTYLRRYNPSELRRGWFEQLSVSEILCLRIARKTLDDLIKGYKQTHNQAPEDWYDVFFPQIPELKELKNSSPPQGRRNMSFINIHWLAAKLQKRGGAEPETNAIGNQTREFKQARDQLKKWIPQTVITGAEKLLIETETLRYANNPEDSGAMMDAMIRRWPEQALKALQDWHQPHRASLANLLFLERLTLYIKGGTMPGHREIILEALEETEEDLYKHSESQELHNIFLDIRNEVLPAFDAPYMRHTPTTPTLFLGEPESGQSFQKRNPSNQGFNNNGPHKKHNGKQQNRPAPPLAGQHPRAASFR